MTNINKREYLTNIKPYLSELEILANATINKKELFSLKETNDIRYIANTRNSPIKKIALDFAEKNGAIFNNYINKLHSANDKEIYIWTTRSNICGLYKVNSIKSINFAFPFDLNDEGIILFLSVNLQDQLLLDFFIDDTDKKIIEIETQGDSWYPIDF